MCLEGLLVAYVVQANARAKGTEGVHGGGCALVRMCNGLFSESMQSAAAERCELHLQSPVFDVQCIHLHMAGIVGTLLIVQGSGLNHKEPMCDTG